MGISDRDGALFWATGIDNTGLIKGKAQAVGIIKGMTSQITRMDVFGGLSAGAAIAFTKIAKDAAKFAKDYETAMKEVQTISAAVQDDYKGYSDVLKRHGFTLTRIFDFSAYQYTIKWGNGSK